MSNVLKKHYMIVSQIKKETFRSQGDTHVVYLISLKPLEGDNETQALTFATTVRNEAEVFILGSRVEVDFNITN